MFFTLSVGSRYLRKYDDESAVYYYGKLTIDSYGGKSAPSDSLGLIAGAGSRFYGAEFTPRIRPYFSLFGEFETSRVMSEDFEQKIDANALNYGFLLGFRFDFYESIFFELETDVFKSSLVRTSVTESGGSKVENTTFGIEFDTIGEKAFEVMTIGIGMVI